jgi:alginate O-acetyltransferase complex protein AlgI
MNYTDCLFVTLFALLVCISWSLDWLGRPGIWLKEFVLIAISWIIIYSWGGFGFIVFVAIVSTNYLISLGVGRDCLRRSRALIALAVTLDIGLLALFKYSGFLTDTITALTGIPLPPMAFGIPIAISFYTLHIISYLIDLHKGSITRLNIKNYIFYLSFFPHLIAGPIVRAWQLSPQIGKSPGRRRKIIGGMNYFIIGYSLKTLAGDNIGMAIDPYWQGGATLQSAADHWAIALLYYGQIYSDFAGYSLMAIGMAMLLGYKFPANFRSPMIAFSLQNFWRRWHITLSRWLRDYLYITLGGNRQGVWQTRRNLLVTMLLGGLWHGANWTFVIWGGMHGLGLVIERCLPKPPPWCRPWVILSGWIVVQAWVMMAWVFFRSPTLETATGFIHGMVRFGGAGAFDLAAPVALILPFAILPILHNTAPLVIRVVPRRYLGTLHGALAGSLFVVDIMMHTATQPFIYFKF